MHIPVLQKEVLQYLDPKPNENFIDATIGEGGHVWAIVERILPKGRVLGIDWTPELIRELEIKIQKSKIKSNLILVYDNFANLKRIVKDYKFGPVHGILFDLGMSSWHLEKSGRGFSFRKEEPLDMRYNPKNPLTALNIINDYSPTEIEKILKEYGEERRVKKIVKEIARLRKRKPIKTTFQLRELLNKIGITPRRTFQALRIAVNDELNNLKKALPQTLEVLRPGGRLVIISFHSLEDRIVKNFLASAGKKATEGKEGSPKIKILTKKPVRPREEEIKINPRSRSAKLRAAVKL